MRFRLERGVVWAWLKIPWARGEGKWGANNLERQSTSNLLATAWEIMLSRPGFRWVLHLHSPGYESHLNKSIPITMQYWILKWGHSSWGSLSPHLQEEYKNAGCSVDLYQQNFHQMLAFCNMNATSLHAQDHHKIFWLFLRTSVSHNPRPSYLLWGQQLSSEGTTKPVVNAVSVLSNQNISVVWPCKPWVY